jgi:hypothetical protein
VQSDSRLIQHWSCSVWFATHRALMESKLLGGTTLIVDRYTYSGVAFSAAKGLDIEWCKVSLVALACIMIFYLCMNTWKLTSDTCTISGSRCWTYSSRSCNLSGCTTRGILFTLTFFDRNVYTHLVYAVPSWRCSGFFSVIVLMVSNTFDFCYIIYSL